LRYSKKTLSNRFINELNLPENQLIRELAARPLYLYIICLLFQSSTPSLHKQAQLYKRLLKTLLLEWDETKGVCRDCIPLNLTWLNIIEILSQVAAIAFETKKYSFEEEQIQAFISNHLQEIKTHDYKIIQQQVNSLAVFKALTTQYGLLIEKAHGIYSFSHRALYEYYVAKNIADNFNSNTLDQILDDLLQRQHLFLLLCEMLPNVDALVLAVKEKVDTLISNDQKIQGFLVWLQQKSSCVADSGQVMATRIFYLLNEFALAHIYVQNSLERAFCYSMNVEGNMMVDHALSRILVCAEAMQRSSFGTDSSSLFLDHAYALTLALATVLSYSLEPHLRRSLQGMSDQLPNPSENEEKFTQWWVARGQEWTRNLRTLIIEQRNIGHDWQFSQHQKNLLHQYHDANLLLINGLKRASCITPVARQKIEATLLLPI
jgi:predicted NACHT family NTPase